jgi:hypothetical protein
MAIPKAPVGVTETSRDTFARWLADGSSWIGIFENHDLGHFDLGRRIALPYDMELFDRAELKMRAPDHKSIGLGWRYLLVAKCQTVTSALAQMTTDAK